MNRFHIRYADVAATLALLMAGGGTAYAAGVLPHHSVGTAQLKTHAVTTKKLHPGAVSASRLARGAVRSAAVADGSITLADLHGADLSGAVSLNVPASSCTNVTLGVSGAQVDQVAVFAWRGDTNPSALMTGPARVSSADHVVVPMCNVSGSSVIVSDAPVRIITFD